MANKKSFWANLLNINQKPVQQNTVDNSWIHGYDNVWAISVFDGEKNPGEMGLPKKYLVDHASLRMRSWESYLKSDITQMIVGKHISWIVGSGLKLQLEPAKLVLESFGISIPNEKQYARFVEEKFGLYSNAPFSSWSNNSNLHLQVREALKNAIIGGDVLVRFRMKDRRPQIQLIDGEHVRTPDFGSNFHSSALGDGNVIVDGIEINPRTKEHVAFFVKNSDLSFTRIPAKGIRTGRTTAFLFTGFKYRLDDQRGIPLLAAVLQTLKMLDRYKEATVSAAEERAKIAYSIEHDKDAEGTNPLMNRVKAATGREVVETTTESLGDKLAKLVSKTTQKTAFNLPPGAILKKLTDDVDIKFGDFFSSNIDLVAATMQTPPAVATSKYDTSYSSSRAALKDWEHVIKIKRTDLSFFIYQPFFELWFQMEVLTDTIEAPGFKQAIIEKNKMFMLAFLKSRFIGPNIPHIDPLKEVKAERAKLGPLAANTPLTTVEKATENLSEGDSWANQEKFEDEIKRFPLEPEPETTE